MSLRKVGSVALILVATLSGQAAAERSLVNGFAPVYSPDGRTVAFERDEGFGRKIGLYDRSSGAVSRPALGSGTACHPFYGPHGELYYVYNALTNTNYEIYKGTAKDCNGFNVFCWDGESVRRLTSGLFHDMTPSVSPDGRKLYFATTREDKRHFTNSLFELDLTKADAKPVLAVNGSINYCSGVTSPSISPDGKMFVWAEYGGWTPPYRIRMTPVSEFPVTAPEKIKPLTNDTREFAFAPKFDSTGRYLCVTSTSNNEKWGIHVFDLKTGRRCRIVDGKEGAFSPDGRYLVYERGGTVYESEWKPEEAFK